MTPEEARVGARGGAPGRTASWEGTRRPWGGSQRGYSVRSGQPTVLGHNLRVWLGRDPRTRTTELREGGSSEEAPSPVFLFPLSPSIVEG